MSADKAFNPLDKSNLGKSVVKALLDVEASPLGSVEKFTLRQMRMTKNASSRRPNGAF